MYHITEEIFPNTNEEIPSATFDFPEMNSVKITLVSDKVDSSDLSFNQEQMINILEHECVSSSKHELNSVSDNTGLDGLPGMEDSENSERNIITNRTCCSKFSWFCSNCWCDFENTIFESTRGINKGIEKFTRDIHNGTECYVCCFCCYCCRLSIV